MTKQKKAEVNEIRFYESGPVGSFGEAVRQIRTQIRAEDFHFCNQDLMEEIVRIMAEMMILPDDAAVAIGGVKMPAGFVREIYATLEEDHVKMVLTHYCEQKHRIRFPKTYLRTALYNAAFELEGRIENDVRQELK